MALSLRATNRLQLLLVPITLIGSSLLVWDASNAAFSAQTSNGVNNWAAASVAIGDDDADVAMFNATGLKPNNTGTHCIKVTYNGDTSASVKLHGTTAGTLGTYLSVTVEEGTGATFGAACTGFTPSATIYTGTLANFGTNHSSFATGVGSFAPTTAGETKSYRFTYVVQDNAAAQGTTASATFTWESRSV